MNLNEYSGNSIASRSGIKKTEEKVPGTVKVPKDREVKETFGKKLASSLIASDSTSIKDYILWDVLVPTLKNTVIDTIENSIEMLFLGNTGARRSNGKVNYSGIYSGLSSSRVVRLNDDRNERPNIKTIGTSGCFYEQIAMSKPECEDVLWRLRNKEAQYGLTSVSDLYDAITEVIGQDPFKDVREFTDNKWGWSDVGRARYDRCGNGYVLRMPRIEPL